MRNAAGYKAEAVRISSGQTVSRPARMDAFTSGIFMIPAAFTGTTVTFQVTNDPNGAVNFTPLFDKANAAISITVAVSRAYPLPLELQGCAWFKFVSGTAEGADRDIQVGFKY